jgi:hypothetical protein
MEKLNLPQYPIKIKEEGGKQFIFDSIRKKYLLLTPEEWVRQNFIQYLIQEKDFKASLIAIEIGLKLNELKKRADIVIYDENAHPTVLIECKAPKVKIKQETFEQISRYNMVFKVPYLVVTNGLNHYCAKINYKENSYEFLTGIPRFKEL